MDRRISNWGESFLSRFIKSAPPNSRDLSDSSLLPWNACTNHCRSQSLISLYCTKNCTWCYANLYRGGADIRIWKTRISSRNDIRAIYIDLLKPTNFSDLLLSLTDPFLRMAYWKLQEWSIYYFILLYTYQKFDFIEILMLYLIEILVMCIAEFF